MKAAILVLGEAATSTARNIQSRLRNAEILGLENRVTSADKHFTHFGDTIRALYEEGRPIIALCAAGIIIRALAPLLQNKRIEPPVLAVAEDGSAVVPLLGGLSGVNDLARTIAQALEVPPAITTTGELRFGINLLHPPAELTLANPEAAKTFMSNLLAGENLRVNGSSRWLTASKLPLSDNGQLTISITPETRAPQTNELIYHPRTVAVAIDKPGENLVSLIEQTLDSSELSKDSLALLLVHEKDCASPHIHQAAQILKAPLRIVSGVDDLATVSVENPAAPYQIR
jgi:cobalt-precorrin 5A hydrolase/precorrin-3B C17-methyltransferase